LLDRVWGGAHVGDDTVPQRISCLRRVFGGRISSKYIETVPKRGYRFVGDVRIE
jgi:transcriptional activator of cad operon